MAKLFPSIENINNLKVQPTAGERYLLNFLVDSLDDSYEVYFQPFVNGEFPDIVIMRKNSGIMIIEVKDWRLEHYHIDANLNWRLNKNNALLKSPIDQVENYKNNFFDLHIDGLIEEAIITPPKRAMIACALYFHNETQESVNRFFQIKNKKNINEVKKLKYFDLLAKDSLTIENFSSILKRTYLSKESYYFNDEHYKKFKRFLDPPLHMLEDGKEIIYNKIQEKFIVSKPGEQKIKGVAGSGKTIVLAKRAVNSVKRTKNRALILTFNISLKNYIHDQISDVRETFRWDNFYIANYHQFIKTILNDIGIKFIPPQANLSSEQKDKYYNREYFSNIKLFLSNAQKFNKYDAIFIDEVQDYEIEWLEIIKKCFLKENGEYVLFGDEKQNIYSRLLEDRHIKTNVIGRWNKLETSYRLQPKIARMGEVFQKEFFDKKYFIEELIVDEQQTFIGFDQVIRHYYYNEHQDANSIFPVIMEVAEELMVHPNDMCILGEETRILRDLCYSFRKKAKEETTTTFEIKEVYEDLEKKYTDKKDLDKDIKQIRRSKKTNFWMNSGKVKLATIHSFKGSEIDTLFLMVNDNKETDISELIYTGITRCRNKLIIINIKNQIYKDFFEKNCEENFVDYKRGMME